MPSRLLAVWPLRRVPFTPVVATGAEVAAEDTLVVGAAEDISAAVVVSTLAAVAVPQVEFTSVAVLAVEAVFMLAVGACRKVAVP